MTRFITQLASACCVALSAIAAPLDPSDEDAIRAGDFRLQILHQEPLPETVDRVLSGLQEELDGDPPTANLKLEVLDLGTLSDEQKSAIDELQHVRFWPAALLHLPESWGTTQPLVFGASENTIQRLIHSPIRQRISDELIRGTPAVWCLVESGDQTADQQALDLLQATLLKIQGDRPRSDFLVERIRRNDPAEQSFLKILMGPARRPITGPVFVPVFGRGYTSGPIPASLSGQSRIIEACEAILADDSKSETDYDLLFSSMWQELPEPQVKQAPTQEEPPRESPTLDPPQKAAREPAPRAAGHFAVLIGGGVLLLGALGIASLKFRS